MNLGLFWRTFVRPRILVHKPASYWRGLIQGKGILRPRFLFTLVVMMLVNDLVSAWWPFQLASSVGLDALQRALPVPPLRHVRVVEIDNTDYLQTFGATSPLEPAKVRLVLDRLLALEPAAIVVDIATNDTVWRQFVPPDTSVPIVWARSLEYPRDSAPVGKALWGGKGTQPLQWGYAAYQPRLDGYISEFPRTVATQTGPSSSLHWAGVLEYCRKSPDRGCQGLEDRERSSLSPLLVRDRAGILVFPLRDVMSPGFGEGDNPLRGRLAFLGGSYSDRHPSHLGWRPGVELLALAAESELDHEQIAIAGRWTKYALDILIGLVLSMVHHYLRPLAALFATLLFSQGMVLCGSFLAFTLGAFWYDSIPAFVGLWMELMVTAAERAEAGDHPMAAPATVVD
jgi:CHASE2 domain